MKAYVTNLDMIQVYDEYENETDYYISGEYPYYTAYESVDGGYVEIARIRVYSNHMTPYENRDTGVLYDSIEWLCQNAA